MSDEWEARLAAIVRASPRLIRLLTMAQELDLPRWRIVSGAVYRTVWNALTGRAADYGIKDYDLIYFDGLDPSYQTENRVIRRVAAASPPIARRWSRCATRRACIYGSKPVLASRMRRWPAPTTRSPVSSRRPSRPVSGSRPTAGSTSARRPACTTYSLVAGGCRRRAALTPGSDDVPPRFAALGQGRLYCPQSVRQ